MSIKAVDAISTELIKGLYLKNMTVRELATSTSISFQLISDIVGANHYAALSSHQYLVIATILELDFDKLSELGATIEPGLSEIPY